MSSAAKLRKYGRGTAAVAAAALVVTSFGPTAFAWDGPGNDVKTAKTGSIGLVDTNRATPNTQGATAVQANAQSQPVGDIRMVVPATYAAGDYIDLELPINSDPAKRILWSANANVDVTGPFAATTHVGADSQTTTTDPNETEETAPLTAFKPAAGQTSPSKPNVTTSLVSSAYGDSKLRIKFNSSADASQFNAKFVLTLSGLKVNVGSDVPAGNVVVTATAYNANDAATTLIPSASTKTIPAVVSQIALSAETSSLTADRTAQALGPITVAATGPAGFTSGQAVTVGVGGLDVATSPNATVTWYNASNAVVGAADQPAGVTPGSSGTVTATAPSGATRAVFRGVVVQTTGTPGAVNLSIAAGGGLTPPTGPLSAAGVNQTDIDAPGNAQARIAVNPPIARLGGANRYETAVKIAQQFATNSGVANDEVDNLVIASGQSFPDALSAGYLAQTKGAPIVLTQQGELPQIVSEFIRNRGVKNVYLVGGDAAISSGVEDRLKGTDAFDWDGNTLKAMNAKLQVVRIAGAGRFETNRAVNEYAAARTTTPVGTTVPSYGLAARKTAIVVNGLTPWDALAAGPMVAGSQNPASGTGALPIVLTAGSSLAGPAKAQLQTLDITHAIFVGGYSVLPQSLEGEAAKFGTTAGRLGGENRWQTAESVGNFLIRSGAVNATGANPGFEFARAGGTKSPLLTNGGVPRADGWADALAAGPIAAQGATVLALTTAASLPADTKDLLTVNRAVLNPVVALGLGEAVSTEVVGQANQAVAD